MKISHLKRDLNRWSLLLVLGGLLIAVPALTIFFSLFMGAGEMWDHVSTYLLPQYVSNTIVILLGSVLLTTLLGVSSAWIVCRYKLPFGNLLEELLVLPLAIPSYISAYAYVGLLGNGGTLAKLFSNSDGNAGLIDVMNIYGLIWVLSFSLYPYVYVSVRSCWQGFPVIVEDTATLLGTSKTRYFTKIALPFAIPAILGGLFLVVMEVLNDYGAAKYYGINTFTTGIFRSWTALEDLQSGFYLTAILVAGIFILLAVVAYITRKKSYALPLDQGAVTGGRKQKLGKYSGPIAFVVIAITLLFGLFLPVAQLLYWAVWGIGSLDLTELLTVSFQTIALGVFATFCIILVAIALIYFNRWNPIKKLGVFKRLATVGYILPGAIIGLAVIKLSSLWVNGAANMFNFKAGFFIYGSISVLLYAYIFRFLAVATAPLEAGARKLGEHIGESSQMLGVGRIKSLFKVDLPLLRPAIWGAATLVMIDVIKELPLTLILKPTGIQTLAIYTYAYADDENLPQAGAPALLLIVVVTIFMLVFRRLKKWEGTSNKL